MTNIGKTPDKQRPFPHLKVHAESRWFVREFKSPEGLPVTEPFRLSFPVQTKGHGEKSANSMIYSPYHQLLSECWTPVLNFGLSGKDEEPGLGPGS